MIRKTNSDRDKIVFEIMMEAVAPNESLRRRIRAYLVEVDQEVASGTPAGPQVLQGKCEIHSRRV